MHVITLVDQDRKQAAETARAEPLDVPAGDALFASLYAELHQLARRQLARRGSGSIGVTTLLHEAYVEMAGRTSASFPDRARFMGYAARVMRGLIIDRARERHAIKRGGLFEITSLATDVADNAVDHRELSAIGARGAAGAGTAANSVAASGAAAFRASFRSRKP